MSKQIYVNMRQSRVGENILGPHTRYCLWVSGCNRRCPGCISPESHDMQAGTPIPAGALAWEVILSDVEGITISGGEPFLQAEALCEFLRHIKRHRDVGVIVYTGYVLEELSDVAGAKELIELCDLIIDGPYIQQLDDGKALRGSSNQRVIPVTQRYAAYLDLYGSGTRQVQTPSALAPQMQYAGIPTNSTYF